MLLACADPEAPATDSDLGQSAVDHRPTVSFPRVGVRIVQPRGFEVAENFYGFIKPKLDASVLALSFDEPYSEIAQAIESGPMAFKGMTLESKREIEVDGLPALLLRATQFKGTVEFLKWSVVFGDEQQTKMVTATFPKTEAPWLSKRLKSIVLSARLDQLPGPLPVSDLRFTLAEPAELVLSKGIDMVLTYTKDGAAETAAPEDPLFLATRSFALVDLSNLRSASVERLFQTSQTKVFSLISDQPLTIDGLSGHELIADAQDIGSGTPLVIYQVLLKEGPEYILFQGLVGASKADDYLPEFRALARSLKREAP